MTERPKIKPVQNGTTCVVLARLSYTHLDAPYAAQEGNEKKYSLSAIIDKSDTESVEAIKRAIGAALEAGVAKCWKGTRPNIKATTFKYPLKDGDIEKPDNEAYRGSVYFSASSCQPVGVFDTLKKAIDPAEAYSGCYALVSVNFFPYSKGSNGIGGGLNAVMKVADGDRLGGGGPADASAFNGVDIPLPSAGYISVMDL